MQPLKPFTPIPPTREKVDALKKWAMESGLNPDDVEKVFDQDMRGDWFGNDTYVVVRLEREAEGGWPPIVWLSIRRQDRAAIRDWRDFQAIKNQLLGPECEAVELYPAESRKVDSANQYHLWGFKTTEARFPFGFGDRFISDEAAAGSGAQQRAGASG